MVLLTEPTGSSYLASNGWSRSGRQGGALTPNDTFLIHEVIDYFDAVAQLELRLLGHGKNGPHELAGFDFLQGRNAGRITLFKVRSVTGHL
jgi:hypothetical protein